MLGYYESRLKTYLMAQQITNLIRTPFFILLFSCVLFYDCKNATQEIGTIKIDTDKTNESALSEIAKSVTAIPLETNSECLISHVRRVKFTDKYIYVSDNRYLYQFDIEGKFIRRINSIGRGPGEILTFTDFFIDENDDIIFIATLEKLQQYNSSGTLTDEIPIQGLPEQVLKVDTSVWINFTDGIRNDDDGKSHNISKMIRLNKDFIPVDSLIICDTKMEFAFSYINPSVVFYSFAKNLTFFYYPSLLIGPTTQDTLFQFTNNKLVPIYKLDFGDKLYELNRVQKAERGVPPYKRFRINTIFVTAHYIFSSYSIDDNDYFLCYDMEGNKMYNMGNGFTDDTFNTGKVQLKQFNFGTKKLYFTKDGYEVVGKVEGVDANSNPVIFIVNLK